MVSMTHSLCYKKNRKRSVLLLAPLVLAVIVNLKNIPTLPASLPSLAWVMGGALERPDAEEKVGPFSRIVLMGQFNYGLLPVESIVTWVDSMKRAQFADVIVRGNFLNETVVDELRTQHGVNVILDQHEASVKENGFFSPYLNLRDALLEYSNKTKKNEVDGVLYMHDDALPNLTMLSDIFSETKGTSFVGTDLGRPGLQNDGSDVSYMNPRVLFPDVGVEASFGDDRHQKSSRVMSIMAYRMYPNRTSSSGGQYTDFIGNRTYDTFRALDKTLFSWGQRILPRCQGGQWAMSNDPLAAKYLENEKRKSADGSEEKEYYLQLPPFAQADFLYVPIDHAEEFAGLATLTANHRIWLECAMPMIVDQITRMRPKKEQVSIANLCTTFSRWRGKPEMIRNCHKRGHNFAVYHPIKLGHNTTLWKQYFEEFNEAYLRQTAAEIEY